VDESSGGWGHINVDDIQFSDSPPALDANSRDKNAPLWGFADTHAHPGYGLAFGGNLIQGKLFSPLADQDARRRDALPTFIESANFEAIGSLAGLLGPFVPGTPIAMGLGVPFDPLTGAWIGAVTREATRPSRLGYPELVGYPKFDQPFGNQMYEEWIKRAYDGGLRLVSALAVNNWLLSSHGVKQLVFGPARNIDDRSSADAQIAHFKLWVQQPQNRDWVEIAYSPEDARRIINQNKLAIVLGIEVDLLGNFAPNRTWTAPEIRVLTPNPANEAEEASVRAAIAEELDRLYRMGVRQVTPYHYVNGSFGGTAVQNRVFNEVSRKFTGRNFTVESGAKHGIRYRLDNDGWGLDGSVARTIISGQPNSWEQNWVDTPLGHVNTMGMTRTGEILVEEVMKRGMLLDTEHASFKTIDKLICIAAGNDYPLMSSHTTFIDLGLTGTGEFTHNALSDDHDQNFRRFGTTKHGDMLRHEGMNTRAKVEAIARLGGTVGPLMSSYRVTKWGTKVENDSDGSSKSWAQMYLYAVDVMKGKGVGLSTDRCVINFVGPRFGPNAAFKLGDEEVEALNKHLRGAQVEAQQKNKGVRYDSPITEWRGYRFDPTRFGFPIARAAAYAYTGKDWEHEDAWRAIAAFKAGRNPWPPEMGGMGARAEIPWSGAPGQPLRIENFARGFFAASEEQLEKDCGVAGLGCWGLSMSGAERYAAYCVKSGITPSRLRNHRDDPAIWEHYRWVKKVWDHWSWMEGDNEPLRRYKFGRRDFDINIDGVAHYGLLPDFLQDLRNIGLAGQDLGPLFRSAEDYVQMWEKAVRRSRAGGLRAVCP
jgi:microsomal dipeptidase-like Zn-dependent dipeptidase